MPTVAAALIVKNESALIARCLESVKKLDGIFVADTGSINQTVPIIKKFTPNVCTDYVWKDSFADARNHVKSKVKAEYILSIDADEVLHDPFEVKQTVELMEQRGILAANVLMVSGSSPENFVFPRLFKNVPEVWWEGAAHNHVSVKGVDIGRVRITYTWSPAHAMDLDRTFRILKKEVERTNNPREVFYLAREYWYRHKYEEAIKYYTDYVLRSGFLPEKAEAYLIMARCYWALGQGDQARLSCAQAIIINAHFKEAVKFMATLCGYGSGHSNWQANADQWLRMAETATNERTLFVR